MSQLCRYFFRRRLELNKRANLDLEFSKPPDKKKTRAISFVESEGGGMKHVLVVEDNEINQDLIVRRLKKRGFKVSLAGDGEEGLNLIRTIRPDIVLLDMSIPKKDGWTVAREVRSEERDYRTPIIALTAHAMQGDREKALDAGCDEYESKPIEFEQLFEKMDALLAS